MKRIDQMGLVNHIIKYISKTHKEMLPRQMNTVISCANAIISEMESECKPSRLGMTLQEWLQSDDTGLSSRFMAGVNPFANTPLDSSDFGRCYRFDKAVNGKWDRERVRAASAEWARIIDAWDGLCVLHEQGRNKELTEWLRRNETKGEKR